MEYVLTATKEEARAGSYYDKIAAFYDLTFKLNGYGRSLDQYFANYPLPVSRGARILDAGCGTGLLTLALMRSLHFPVSITALDLSATSITAARKAVIEGPGRTRDVTFAEGNLLSLPFADNSLDMVVTSGALEYVPLAEGMAELARVIMPGGHLLHIPCRRPSPATTSSSTLPTGPGCSPRWPRSSPGTTSRSRRCARRDAVTRRNWSSSRTGPPTRPWPRPSSG